MTKMMDWIDETPNRVTYVSIVTMFLLTIFFSIFLAIAPENGVLSTIGIMILLLLIFSVLFFWFAVARTLGHKNRSFWWYGLFILVPLIGLIVILALDDHSDEICECQHM